MPRLSRVTAVAIPADEQPAFTPERQALVQAMADRQQLHGTIENARSALHEAEQNALMASKAFYQAEEELEWAMPGGNSARMPHFNSQEDYEAWQTRRNRPPLPIAEARAKRDAAKDEHSTAKRTIEFQKDQLKKAEDAGLFGRGNVLAAVNALIAADPAVDALIEDARRKARAYFDAEAVVGLLVSRGLLKQSAADWNKRAPLHDAFAWPLSASWRETLQQLEIDPITPLPTARA